MEDKRRSKRLQVNLNLDISSLFKQDNVRVDHIDAPIEVINISKDGIGFKSKSVLPVDYYFNAKLELGDVSSCLYSVVKIIRQDAENVGTYTYGAEFVGMPSVLQYIFDEYEERESK
ncbi:PilZ domain-containing protein [Anaerocolumna sedimenticola]|uniref:PilZ domain-containing protein n=1 Tax=Anaerocolumna sedimenticola TaxID=2696063 RepID=A0A6P1TJA4_9FIRM|nr:PilZ domain-containing protein [Anaerocolumna sedimenticola]QHQ61280.1 PilZ domain-containing protein [Anaerocolumna sedimenticola]